MKKKIRLSESKFRKLVETCVNRALNEGIYDYPDGIDHIILCSENDQELYNQIYWPIIEMLARKINKGIDLDVNVLANSSIVKKYQMACFKKYKQEQINNDFLPQDAPILFRQYIAEKMINDAQDKAYNDNNSEVKLESIIKRNLKNVIKESLEEQSVRFENMTEESLWKLRQEIKLNSLFTGDYQNTFGFSPDSMQEFFDGYMSYLTEMEKENGEDLEFNDFFKKYDTPENLWNWYNCYEDFSWVKYEDSEENY